MNHRIDWLTALICDLSQLRLSQYLQKEILLTKVVESDFPVYGHDMAMSLIANSGLRIVFKSHFNPLRISQWAAQAFSKPPELIKRQDVGDFAKEYCNLTAGALKHELELQGLQTGISLPLLSRGFDEVFFPLSDGKRLINNVWALENGHEKLVCSMQLEIVDDTSLKCLKLGKYKSISTNSGDVESL